MLSIESALVVLVPEAEAWVHSFRDRYDPSAAAGVPAHVMLLYPFRPPHNIDMTSSIWARFPDTTPYGGRRLDIVPHLRIAQLADEQRLDRIAEEFAGYSSKAAGSRDCGRNRVDGHHVRALAGPHHASPGK